MDRRSSRRHGKGLQKTLSRMKRELKWPYVGMVSFSVAWTCLGAKYMRTRCFCRRTWPLQIQPFSAATSCADIGPTWRAFPIASLPWSPYLTWSLCYLWCMLERMTVHVRWGVYICLPFCCLFPSCCVWCKVRWYLNCMFFNTLLSVEMERTEPVGSGQHNWRRSWTGSYNHYHCTLHKL